jgi:hypothetical protein
MSKSFQHVARFIPLMVLAVALLAACGGGGNAASGGSPVQVQVTLTDFKIDSSLTTFSVGVPYHFVVTNKGAVAHEFVIMPPEQGAQGSETQLPSTALAGILGKDLTPGTTLGQAATTFQGAIDDNRLSGWRNWPTNRLSHRSDRAAR